MMQRVVIRAKGRVQKVGYRDFVQDIARTFGVVGYVENLRDGNVKIVAEAENNVLKDFTEQIKVKKDFIDVRDISQEYEDATNEFEIFEIRYGKVEEELGDRMGAAVLYIGATNKNIDKGREENKQGFKILAEKQDQMLSKQDQTIEILGSKIDNGFEKMGEKIDNGFDKMDQNFTRLDVKYDKMSKKMDKIDDKLNSLSSIDKTLQKLTDAILELAKSRSR